MDPHDLHLKENNRLRKALSNPLLLNEALLMRRTRARYKECGDRTATRSSRTIPAMRRPAQKRAKAGIDLQKREDARHDFTKAVESGAGPGRGRQGAYQIAQTRTSAGCRRMVKL